MRCMLRARHHRSRSGARHSHRHDWRGLGLFVREGWTWQVLPEVIQNKILTSACVLVFLVQSYMGNSDARSD